LIRIANNKEDWVLGYLDEVWWSRLAQPNLNSWTVGKPLRLIEKQREKDDPEPKALSCYGLLRTDNNEMLLRFVDGRPVSAVTIEYLEWVCQRLAATGKKVLVLVWDNASWHASQLVRNWIRDHNKRVKLQGGVRIIKCFLPVKSPWLNPIEPRWLHGKRAIVEPTRTLTAQELIERVCNYYRVEHLDHLKQKVA
jgi:transposase